MVSYGILWYLMISYGILWYPNIIRGKLVSLNSINMGNGALMVSCDNNSKILEVFGHGLKRRSN